MSNKIEYNRIFLNALRTALIFIAGFLSYEILKDLEQEWNKITPNNKMVHFANRKIFHFLIMFMSDLIILFLILFLFKVQL
jgi:hypothetical protein